MVFKTINNRNYLSQLCVPVATQTVLLLLASYKVHKCAQVNHLVRVKPFFAGYNCCKTILHNVYSDAKKIKNYKNLGQRIDFESHLNPTKQIYKLTNLIRNILLLQHLNWFSIAISFCTQLTNKIGRSYAIVLNLMFHIIKIRKLTSILF